MEVRELLTKYQFPGDDDADHPRERAAGAEGRRAEWGAVGAKLLEACDTFIPEPMREIDKPFLMAVEDVFSIKGRGTVATGRVERGIVKVDEEIEIVGFKDTVKTVVTGVEMFRKLLDEGQAGDNIGALLRGTKREDIERGQVLSKPGSITPHKKFQGEVYVLKKEEGGRHTPFFTNYRPQFYFRTTDVTGLVTLPEGVKMVMPGDNVSLKVELITPIALEEGCASPSARAARPSAPASSPRSSRTIPRTRRSSQSTSSAAERSKEQNHGSSESHHHARMHRFVVNAITRRRRTSVRTRRSSSCRSSAPAAASTRTTRKRSKH